MLHLHIKYFVACASMKDLIGKVVFFAEFYSFIHIQITVKKINKMNFRAREEILMYVLIKNKKKPNKLKKRLIIANGNILWKI